MFFWSNRNLTKLTRAQLEMVTESAIVGLLDARDLNSKRQSQDSLILSFAAGIAFACVAVVVGMGLH